MKTIYENLDTSFVNLPALVRYLRRKNFVGNVRVELDRYEAEIIFSGENEPAAREHDRSAGRIAEGEGALQRVLIRAREAGGTVHVYQVTEKPGEINKTSKPLEHKSLIIEKSSPVEKPVFHSDLMRNISLAEMEQTEIAEKSLDAISSVTKANGKPLDFPFDLSNKVEAKAKQNQLSTDDWETLLSLVGELLRTIDETLANANLNFPMAFQKASAEVSEDYPFLNPNAGVFAYRNGEAEMREPVNAKLFVASINETLRRILSKLSANPKYAEAERATVQSVLALIHHRKTLYDKFYITPQLEKTLRT